MRAAVVVNPTKHADGARFRAEVTGAMAATGWSDPLWLETTPDETGRGLAAAAVAERVDVVLASGGDGTVTGVRRGRRRCSGVPAGRAAGRARGTCWPATSACRWPWTQALAVALTGAERPGLDVGVRPTGGLFVAMAGIGFDADAAGERRRSRSKMRVGWLRVRAVRAGASAGPPDARRRCASTAARRCGAGPAAWSSATSGRCSAASGPAARGGARRRGARPHGADRPGLVRLAGPRGRRDAAADPDRPGGSASEFRESRGSSWTGRSCGNSTAR